MPHFPAADLVGAVPRLVGIARDDPLLAVAAVGAALVALAAAGLLLRRLRRSPGERFRRALAEAEEVTVLTHPNPDPDAMAAAAAVAHLAEHAGTPASIRYPGAIRHQENRAFRTVIGLDAGRIEDAADLDGEVVLVDHNRPRGFDGCERVDPYAVVDHHPGDGDGTAFTDVRPDYGACATVLAEYLEAVGAEPVGPDASDGEELLDADPSDGVEPVDPDRLDGEESVDLDRSDGKESIDLDWSHGEESVDSDWPDGEGTDGFVLSPKLATGLLYGIISDTGGFTRGCTPAEFEASAYLHPGVDEKRLDRIANPPVDREVLDVLARAIAGRDVRGPFVVSDVGEVSNVDAIPQAADELLRLEGVTAVVVYGAKDGTIYLSGRSRDDRVHMGEALAVVVDAVPMSDAGGHSRMGGGQVSVLHLEGLRPQSGMTRGEFTDRIFDALVGAA